MRYLNFLLCLILADVLHGQDTWTPRANYPATNVIATSSFTIGNLGYVFNKAPGSSTTSTLWAFDPSTNSWSQKASLDVPREKSAAFAINGIGYVCAGTATSLVLTNTLHAYDPLTDSWTQKADFPGSNRTAAVAFVVGDKAYVGSGIVGSSVYTDDFFCYDPATDSWSPVASIPGGVRFDASAFTVAGKGYVVAGRGVSDCLSSMYAYDPATDTWQIRAPLAGGPRNRPAAFSIGDRGFVGTGWNCSEGLAYFHEYDPFSNSWTQRANYPALARVWTVGFSIADKGYVGLGLNSSGAFHRYDPLPLTTQVPDLLETRRPRIYPNPAHGACWLEIDHTSNGPVVLNVRDAAGREVLSRTISPASTAPIPLDLSCLPEGMYMVTAAMDGARWVERLVIGGQTP